MSDAGDLADHPGVTLIGRWHDAVAGNAFVICESDDLAPIKLGASTWNGVINLENTPVLGDNECRIMLKSKWDL